MPRKQTQKYRAQTYTGKTFIDDTWLGCLVGIAMTMRVSLDCIRILSRSHASWYVYTNEADMRADIKNTHRTLWRAWIEQVSR